MKLLSYRSLSLVLLVLYCSWSCSPSEAFRYELKEATLVRSLRDQMFYEYCSPLNEAMKIYIELELAKDPLIQLPLEHFYKTEQKIKQERPLLGCYYLESNIASGNKKLFVIIEWNQNAGVLVRLFTNSDYIADKFPGTTL